MPWSVAAPLQQDESISSWLARAALLQGCDPLVLTGSVWPEWRVWTVDVDRGTTDERLQALSAASGIASAHFAHAALREDAKAVAGRALTEVEVWPWVLALGARNRTRRGGQQFCPACLAEDEQPYFRRQWRFAWHVACPRHGILLVDQCAACGAPVAPHRLVAQDRHLGLCSRCRADLREARRLPAHSEVIAFQSAADSVLALRAGKLWMRPVMAPVWFASARFFVSLIRRAGRRQASRLAVAVRALGIDAGIERLPVTALPLELSSVGDRASLFAATQFLMTLGQDPLTSTLKKIGVTRAALQDSTDPLPAPLGELAAALPSGARFPKHRRRTRHSSPRAERTVMGAWLRLQRKVRALPP